MANERARALRRNQTDAERQLWRYLRRDGLDGFRFRRQHPLGDYIVDFVCLEKRLIVELDGGQHAEDAAAAHDRRRDAWLESQNFRVVRLWNKQVYENVEGALTEIGMLLRDPTY